MQPNLLVRFSPSEIYQGGTNPQYQSLTKRRWRNEQNDAAGFELDENGEWVITLDDGRAFVAYLNDEESAVLVSEMYFDEYEYSQEELDDMQDYKPYTIDESEAIEFSAFILKLEGVE